MSDPALTQLTTSLFDIPGARRVRLGPGDPLIREGEAANTVYILMDGSLEVSRNVDMSTAVLAVIDEPGTLVGEMVALGGGTRTATVTAQESADLISLTAEEFHSVLKDNPNLADDLVAIAVRRAEEGELAELLADHFGIVDEDTLVSICGVVEWRRLKQGETLINEGDGSDSVYFVVRGRLLATTDDPLNGSRVKVGEAGRGDVVGEIGLLGRTPRTATVSAVRDSVVARMDEPSFLALVERHPRMMIELTLNAVRRAEGSRWHSAPSTVLALVTTRRVKADWLVDGLERELGRHGKVRRLSPLIVDLALERPGIHDVRRGDIGDVRVSKMVHELEIEADHLIVEVGDGSGPWAERALGMADRVLIATTPDHSEEEADELDSLLGSCPPGVGRTLALVHSESAVRPMGSASIRERSASDQVIHLRRSSMDDVARLARISVGRGNSLVLSGGGGRGFAHIGVYRALTELGYPIDIVGGTSIGGVIGAVIADALTPREVEEWAARHFPNALDYTLPVVSPTKGSRIARSARETFGQRDVEDLWLTYFSMSTDLTTSRPHIHDHGPIALAIRATSAIPGVMPPVPHGEALLIDGGVLNNLPIDVARHKAPLGKVIAVDVAPPRGPGAHGDYGLSVSGWDALRSGFGSRRSPYPGISAVLMRSMITASMRERDDQVTNGLADCYIDLDMRGVSMLEFGDPTTVSQRGYEAAMPELQRWIESIG